MGIMKISIQPSYRRQNGLWVLNPDSLRLPEDFIVYIPPKQVGGNHKHPRKEAFIGFGEKLTLLWQDEIGKTNEEKMNPDGQLLLLIVPSNMPHVIRNESTTSFGLLYEFADDIQHDEQRVEIVKSNSDDTTKVEQVT